jgi:membrane-associated phospholipid phosphatase
VTSGARGTIVSRLLLISISLIPISLTLSSPAQTSEGQTLAEPTSERALSDSDRVFSDRKLGENPPEAPPLETTAPAATGAKHMFSLEQAGIMRFARDQQAIWSTPLHLERSDAKWALPSLAGLGALVASDSWLSRQAPAGGVEHSRTLSNYGTFALAGGAAAMFMSGKMTGDDHASETGWLSGEAALNAAVVDYAMKYAFERERPYDAGGAGRFFAGGSSFPSEHAAVSWAIVGVVAHEYPGTLTKLFSYGLASAVTVARVTGKEHFPSDAVVGGVLGYFIAGQVYQRHRELEAGGGAWATLFAHSADGDRDKVRSPENMGSPYVPPDSWVYPGFERLAAIGYIHSAYLGIRPWTRMQCARLLEEAGESLRYAAGDPPEKDIPRKDLPEKDPHSNASSNVSDGSFDDAADREAVNLYLALSREFAWETRRLDGDPNLGATLDSVYQRTTEIAGPPLTDGYHFAETVINDYGRPFGRGFNQIAGTSGHAEAGPLSASFQGEFEQVPAVTPYSQSIQQAISATDQLPLYGYGTNATNRFAIIGSSVGLTFHDLALSVGKQAEWLGPTESGPFLASTNASSILMFQAANTVPYRVPLLSNLIGPAESVFFIGELTGQNFVYNPPNILGPGFHPQPFIHGNKVSFKPTPNLEFGMGITAVFGGPGLPFTWSEFLRSYYSHKSSTALNPAKRFSGFDVTYRVPRLRKWLTVYNDSLVGDEISPIGSSRPMLSPGIFMPQLPKVSRLALRFEGVKDPFTNIFPPGFIYYDRRYRSGYTNDGNLIGSWVGRDGFGAMGQATYWLSAQSRLECGYRYQEADRSFLEGGRLVDYSLRAETRMKSGIAVSGLVQYEQWMFPLLAASRQQNVTSSLELSFHPRARN